ncbi:MULTISPECIES: LLM class flavin-dependent oxidoreductase [Hydrogenophaga]|uniref:Monooxygenase n=1 Tax=Hydrogenophaga intermedia TaxID=65786 RepID=A0A1L1PFY5_HYDIT|nr:MULTISPECIES: LLM class flavin-dependent oxidoreductase [Hydrogenophaga]AOS79514.1 monooxygenase [Hydrogenophaga sp. PBC]TMU77058.1 LLM class flavin-dependent oxidoreductase [Hydrogenophaga intermedia]CDN86689.1 Monooxygenase [Hydrogenophaga intermedia]
MSKPSRQMTLIAFMQAQNCTNYAGSWRHPSSMTDYLTPEYYQRVARTLEEGKFDMAFFDDRLAIPDIYGGNHRDTVKYGVRAFKLEPTSVLMAMAMATSRLGLGATYSTSYYEPFHIARLYATLDLMTKGRVAWNVVTSMNDSEAFNFGKEDHLEHDLRYDRADEFMEVVMGHWDTWEDDAIKPDKEAGTFANPDKVHRLDHVGQYFKSRGPLPVPRSPQGHPVILQAGQSGRGLAFAARWAEVVFSKYPTLDNGKKQYQALKDGASNAGRDPGTLKIAPELKIIVGETESIAKEKRELIASLSRPIDGLTMMGETLNIDFSGRPYEQPFTDAELAAMSWQSLRDKVVQVSGKKNPSVRDFVEASGRGTLNDGPVFCGTGTQVADQMEEWFKTACDGFVLSGTTVPGTYEDIVRLVVPELQKRGLFRKEYAGNTLRENLGVRRPYAGDWKRKA